MKSGETQIRKKQVVQESPMGQVGGHQSGPQVRVQQHTAESKERIAECVDEEIVDAPVPHQSPEILGASSELFRTTIDDLVQEKAVKETAEEGGGGHGRSRSTSRATELWNIWRTRVGLQANRPKCERRQMRKTALFERRSSLSRSCDTGDVDEEERHSQRGQQRLMYKMVWKRATWMQKSFTRNVTRRGNSEQCISNSEIVKNCAKRFSQGHWAFFGPGSEKKWYGNQSYPREGKWQATAGQMVERFEESGHAVFKSVSPLARGILRRKNNKETIHFTADASNTKLFYRTIHSANQLSIYGAVAGWCEEFGLKPDQTSEERPKTTNGKQIERSPTKRSKKSLVKGVENEEPAAGNIL